MKRFDERDTVFSRMELVPGSKRYLDYYARRPELREVDARFRVVSEGEYGHDRFNLSLVASAFRFLKDLRPLAAGSVIAESPSQDVLSIKEIEKLLHATALDYGAVLYSQTSLGLECFYSVRGRGAAYGTPVNNPLQNALVFAVEMNRDKISRAPYPEESVEVARAYVSIAVIGMILSYYLRELGYEARCHMDGESELIFPAAAQAANLGEMGRMGLLLTEKYGPRIRLGAVTTNLPFTSENHLNKSPRPANYCAKCDLCARRCPGNAIPKRNFSEPQEIKAHDPAAAKKENIETITGTKNPLWKIDHEACFSMWKKYGTDCGICISVCPY